MLKSTWTWLPPLWAWLTLYLLLGSTLAKRLNHPCLRPCTKHAPPMVCEYDFDVSHWSSMTADCKNCPKYREDCFAPSCVPADGHKKDVIVANKQLPGPLIEVCRGDRLIIRVTNSLPNEGTTIHWHAIEQRDTPFMDGVPYITQCPIFPSQTYVYNYTVEYGGTYFWHSHSSEQRGDGLFGGLIVREPKKMAYDVDEHVVILNEWLRISAAQLNVLDHKGIRGPTPYTILINGLGRYPANGTNSIVATFDVEYGKTYRFRVINAGSQLCPMSLAIEGHEDLTLISADAIDIVPVEVSSIRSMAGERYDFILKANKKIGNYWLLVKGIDGTTGCKMNKVFQVAILRYKGAPEVDPPRRANYDMLNTDESKQVNPFNRGTEHPYCVVNLDSTWPDDPSNTREPDYQFFALYGQGMDSYVSNATVKQGLQYVAPNNNNTKTFWRFDSITFTYPPVPLLTQFDMVDPNLFCNSLTVNERHCKHKFCECLHMYSVDLYSVVELVLIDKGFIKVNHPIHLHGFWFRVVSMGTFDEPGSIELFRQMDSEGKIQRKLKNSVLKDTVMVPYNGYTVIRFYADHAGVWLLHCHFESHARSGLDMVFKVGEPEEFPPAPPSIPRC